MTEKDVYEFYNEQVKMIYSEIEARNNTLPVELLFEIHSAFDHLKRYHIDNQNEEECTERAFSHLKRGMLDAFKLKLKYFNDDYQAIIKSKADLRIIDSGTYLSKLLEERKNLVQIARKARLAESSKDFNLAFDLWTEVSDKINKMETEFFDSAKITWAKKQSFFHFSVNFWIGVMTGIISSILVWLVTEKILTKVF